MVILQHVGRKQMLIASLFLTGITYFTSEMILLFADESRSDEETQIILEASRWMAFTGKFFISGSFSVCTSEVFRQAFSTHPLRTEVETFVPHQSVRS